MSNLLIRLLGDATHFNKVINGAKKGAKDFGKSIGTGLLGPMGALSAAGAGAGIIMFAKNAVAAADAIGDGADRMKVSTDEFQRLEMMTREADTSIQSLSTAFERIKAAIAGSDEESKKAQQTLARLGLSAEDLKGLAPEKQFEKIAAALRGVASAEMKAFAAQQIFGKGGASDLAILIDQYDELRNRSSNINLISEDAIRKAGMFNDQIDLIGKNLQASIIDSGVVDYLEQWAGSVDAIINKQSKLTVPGGSKLKDNLKIMFGDVLDISPTGMAFKGVFGRELSSFLPTSGETAAKDAAAAPINAGDVATGKANRAAAMAAKERAIAEKDLSDILAVQAQEAAAAFEAEKAATDRKNEFLESTLSTMEQQIRQQELINAGLGRQAAIEEELFKAKQKNADLTDEELSGIADAAGRLYDLKNNQDAMAESKTKMQRGDQYAATQLERIGAIYGGGLSGDRSLTIQRDISSATKDIKVAVKSINEKIGVAALGNV